MGKTTLALILVAASVATTAVVVPAAQAQASAASTTPTYERQAIGFWKAWDCLIAASAFVAGNTYLVLKIKRFGGIVKFAKSLWKAKSAEERAKAIFKVIGYVAGTGAVVKACTP